MKIASQCGATRVRLFGSVVRGEEKNQSDVDLLVDFKEGCGLLHQIRLKLAIEALLGRSVDIATERTLRPEIKDDVLAEAVEL